MDTAQLGHFYRDQLLNHVMPFWFPRAIDEANGGIHHCYDHEGNLVDTDKNVWAQGRMAWMLLTCYNFIEKRAEWLSWAESALKFLEEHCVDATDGRMYFHMEEDGTPLRRRRYAYSESFACIAYAAHFGATADEKSAQLARHYFDIFADLNFTPGKMLPKSTGKRPTIGLGPRMIMIVTAQELRRYLGDADGYFTGWIDRCIADIRQFFIKPELRVTMEQVAPDGSIIDHFDERTLNAGHSIEGAWFIMEEAKHRGNEPELVAMALDMIDWALERGWDKVHGGLLYFTDVYGKPVQEYWHNMKFWWPHDEALIATALAWKLSGEQRFLDWHDKIRQWSFTHLQAPGCGEWYGYCNRDGSPANTLVGSYWKSFFHHPRALFCCAQHFGAINENPLYIMIVGILNSGGDCPGINAVIEGFVAAAYSRAWRVVGFHDGFEGLLPSAGGLRYEILNPTKVHKIRSMGGTILGTTNSGHFELRHNKLGNTNLDPEILSKAKKTITALGLQALVVIGGDGSARTAQVFANEGVNVITIPKTINNDLCPDSDYTFGFQSAVEVVCESIDRIRTTANAHQRMMVVEVMGDLSGWIALNSGISSDADVVLIPEIAFSLDKVVECVQARKATGQREIIVVVAEGAKLDGSIVTIKNKDKGEERLGGIGNLLSRLLEERTGIETRYCVLGHTQRGGTPCAFDRILGIRFGVAAVKLIESKDFGKSLILKGLEVDAVTIEESYDRLRLIKRSSQAIRTARELGIIFGDRSPKNLHLIDAPQEID